MNRLLPLTLLLAFSTPCFAQSNEALFQEYEILFQEKKYESAIVPLRKAVQDEYLPALNALGEMYEQGLGMEQSDAKAKSWYRSAAERDYPPAQYHLAMQLLIKHVEPSDLEESMKWLEKSAAQNYAPAQYNLAQIYKTRLGGNRTYDAIVLYKKAAAQNHILSIRALCDLYKKPKNLTYDKDEALKYYTQGAALGDAASQIGLGMLYHEGRIVPKDEEKCFYWNKKAAEQGETTGEHNTASAYSEGEGVAKNDSLALYWYEKAAAKNYPPSLNILGNWCELGKNRTPNMLLAENYYRRSAERDNDYGAYHLTILYKKEQGNTNETKLAWLQKHSAEGNPYAQYNLGLKNILGQNLPKNISVGIELLLKAAEQGHIGAQYMLGLLYAEGTDTGKDTEKARFWLQKASDAGSLRAEKALKDKK
jgi:uncharacterized protein